MSIFCVFASRPPILLGSSLGSAASGVGTFVWNEEIFPTLNCAPELASRRITVSVNDTEEGRCPKFPGDNVRSWRKGEVGEVVRRGCPVGCALKVPGRGGVAGRS